MGWTMSRAKWIPAVVMCGAHCASAAFAQDSALDTLLKEGWSEYSRFETRPSLEELEMWADSAARHEIALRAMSAMHGNPSWRFALILDDDASIAAGLEIGQEQQRLIRRLGYVARLIQQRAILNERAVLDVPPEGRDEVLRSYKQKRSIVMSHVDQLLEYTLDAKQLERLRQLKWWRGGLKMIVEDAEVAQLLRLTIPQRVELYLRYLESRSAKENPPQELLSISIAFEPQRDPTGVRRTRAAQQIWALEQQADAYVWAVLTRRQRRKWRELLGTPPAIPWLWSNWSDLLDLGPVPTAKRPVDHDPHEKLAEPERGGIGPDMDVANRLVSRSFQALTKTSVTERLALTQEQQRAIRELASVTHDILQRLEQQDENVRRTERVARSRRIIHHAEALVYGLLSDDQTALLRSASR